MNTTSIRTQFVTAIVGAAIAGVAAPALMFLGAGTAEAAGDASWRHATVTTTQTPGHVAMFVEPGEVSAPRVWGAYDSPVFIVAD